jgi:hypothetical protein
MTLGSRGLAAVLVMGTLALAAVTPVVALSTPGPAPGRVEVLDAGPPVRPASGRPAAVGTAPPLSWLVPAPTGWAPAATAAIRPGLLTETAGGGRCTSNFVFVAGERRFLGQAAHCAGTGVATETDGCASGTRPLGTAVVVQAADGSRHTGRLAYSSWIAMQGRGETDPRACAHNDFALVELAPADHRLINPSLPVLGGPTGLRVGGPPAGEPVFGYGGPGPKPGTAGRGVGAGFGHEIYTVSPGAPGESGSAFVDADGAAFGVLVTLNLSARPVSNGATDLAAALAYANTHGGIGAVTLALGTEPFRPSAG